MPSTLHTPGFLRDPVLPSVVAVVATLLALAFTLR
jgi:hypothetical protein